MNVIPYRDSCHSDDVPSKYCCSSTLSRVLRIRVSRLEENDRDVLEVKMGEMMLDTRKNWGKNLIGENFEKLESLISKKVYTF